MKSLFSPNSGYTRPILTLALFLSAFCFIALLLIGPPSSEAGKRRAKRVPAVAGNQSATFDESAAIAAFRDSAGGSITPVIVELKEEPGVMRKIAAEKEGRLMSVTEIGSHAVKLYRKQNEFLGALPGRGIRALLRQTSVPQIDGSIRHIQYRFTYLLNGFVAYVATEDIPKLRALPEVADVSEAESEQYHLDKAIDHSLGTHTDPADRRTAVYGPTQEFHPDPADPTHPEAPRTTKVDGFEGQNMNIAVIDSGADWRHPMFGGIGQATALPRVSGQPEHPSQNKKIIYFYSFAQPVGDPTDDFGHGTHVSSTAAGYSVDGTTTPRTGYGTGKDGTGIGPTINNEQLFGSAPQARILVYKVCGPANACAGDIPLAIEDAASPVTLVGAGDGLSEPTTISKPVADVINLSLGSTAGDPAAANSRAVNNAALAGTIVCTSAGNSGPGLGTVGNPGTATLAIASAASVDPGSLSVGDVLVPDSIPGELCDDSPRPPTCDTDTHPAGPPAEEGVPSDANAVQPGERVGMKLFPVAGAGPLPDESVSAHYVFVDRRPNPPPPVPVSVTNRIALVKGSGTFAQIANPIALQNPAAILIITSVESATAVQVINGIPTYTISPSDGNYLIDRLRTGDAGDGNDDVDVPNGAVSELPMRLMERGTLAAFEGSMAGFSSRGPSDHANASFRVIKPDVASPGVGVVAAATAEGIPDDTVGLASTTGYTSSNGTSMSSPITAGSMALIRQRIREQLSIDSTNLADPQYTAKRFDTVMVARAMLQNSATNLRSGLGVPQGDGASSVASINEMGAGHINIADALTANAIMVSPTLLLGAPREYSSPPAPSPTPVLLPTASFAAVPVVRLNDTIVRTREVIIRDVTGGAGGGTYNLAWQNNRSADHPGFEITLVGSESSTTPISSIDVPAGGQTSFFVRVAADGTQIDLDPTEFQWYVTATQAASGKKLRMPFYFRAITAVFPNSVAPNQQVPQGVEQPSAGCPIDTNGSYTVNWTYTTPANTGFRVQEATFTNTIFFDNADQLLMPIVSGTSVFNENSIWRDAGIAGTPQIPPEWTSEVNPATNSLAYFIPAVASVPGGVANQNHSLAMKNAIALPATGITLTFTTRQTLANNFDFGFVEVSSDNINWFPAYTATGTFTGTREIDLSAYAGQSVRVRFRLTTPQGVSGTAGRGWYVENIRISSDNFQTIADVPAAQKSLNITGQPAGTYQYRVAALYANPNPVDPNTTIIGPYSNIQCVVVAAGPPPGSAVSRKMHGSVEGNIALPLIGDAGIECRSGGATGNHQMVITFPANVSISDAEVTSGSGNVTSFTPSGTVITVGLSDVHNAQTIIVTLFGVNDGSTTGNVSIPMGVLEGDTQSDRFVNSADISHTKSESGSAVTDTSFRTDVNFDGFKNSGDISLVKSKSGTALP